jgi:hypothetical protein
MQSDRGQGSVLCDLRCGVVTALQLRRDQLSLESGNLFRLRRNLALHALHVVGLWRDLVVSSDARYPRMNASASWRTSASVP